MKSVLADPSYPVDIIVHRNMTPVAIMNTLANAARLFFVIATVLGTTVACSAYVPANQLIAQEAADEPAYFAGN